MKRKSGVKKSQKKDLFCLSLVKVLSKPIQDPGCWIFMEEEYILRVPFQLRDHPPRDCLHLRVGGFLYNYPKGVSLVPEDPRETDRKVFLLIETFRGRTDN